LSVCNEPKINLLSQRRAAATLVGQELVHLKAVLELEGASDVPARICANKYFHMRLENGHIAGTVSSSDEAGDCRHDHLVRVRSHMRQAVRRGRGVEEVPDNVYGAVHHYTAVLIDGAPKTYAYLECVKSSADRHGSSGLPEKESETDCFTSLGVTMRYVNVTVIDTVVGTLFVRDRHVALYTREVFSTE